MGSERQIGGCGIERYGGQELPLFRGQDCLVENVISLSLQLEGNLTYTRSGTEKLHILFYIMGFHREPQKNRHHPRREMVSFAASAPLKESMFSLAMTLQAQEG